VALVDPDWLRGRTLSVIGLVKNAGKTTALNALLDEIYAAGLLNRPAVTSIGRDGESTDIVTGTEKPAIRIRENTLIATAAELLRLGDFTREILASTGFRTPMGEVYLVKARSGGTVQLGGPSMTEQLKSLRDEFFRLGADCVLIDGAAARRSPGAASVADGVILCTGASLDRSMERVAEQTAFIAELMQLPPFDGAADSPDILILRGAVTEARLTELLAGGSALKGRTLVADDPSKLLFTETSYRKLQRLGAAICLKAGPKLLAVTVNPVSARGWRFDAERFRDTVQSRLPDISVIDIKEDQA